MENQPAISGVERGEDPRRRPIHAEKEAAVASRPGIAAVLAGAVLTLAGCESAGTAVPVPVAGDSAPVTASPNPTTTGQISSGTAPAASGRPADGEPVSGKSTRRPAVPTAWKSATAPFTGDVTFQVPDGWSVTHAKPDTDDYRDPTGKVLLRVRLERGRAGTASNLVVRQLVEWSNTYPGFRHLNDEWIDTYSTEDGYEEGTTAHEGTFTFVKDGVVWKASLAGFSVPGLGYLTFYLATPEQDFSRLYSPITARAWRFTLAG
jgi:hypothetical protein